MQRMVSLKQNRSCEEGGCGRQPLFNFMGEERGRFCAHHKVHGMVDIKKKRRSASKMDAENEPSSILRTCGRGTDSVHSARCREEW